jgi:hypothetical protein
MNEGPSVPFGVWRSVYSYQSAGRVGIFTDESDVLMAMVRTRLVIMSLHPDWGALQMQLAPTGRLIAATWTERTKPDGYYAGAVFQGVAQFILAEDGLSMSGSWAGHNRDMSKVNTGPWTLTYVEPWLGDLPQLVEG